MGAVVVVAALAVAAVVVGRRARRRLPVGTPPVAPHPPAPVPAFGLRGGTGAVYAPAFIVDPGHCFRLCRDDLTDAASPCDRPVEGRGEFVDHRGNVVEVEACATHMADLGRWRFHPVEGPGGAVSG